MPKHTRFLSLAAAAWLCGAIANAAMPTDAEIRARITDFLSTRGEVSEITLLDRRKTCRTLLMSFAPESEVYSYGATLRSPRMADVEAYLICVEVAPDETLNIEYFPEP